MRNYSTAGLGSNKCADHPKYLAGCEACRTASRELQRAARDRAGGRTRTQWLAELRATSRRTHGIRATYVHGCRCDRCRQAEATYKTELRAARRSQP